jgi:hypothetical protein
VRPNEGLIYPRRIVCLDTEADITIDGSREEHRMMLACASSDVLPPGGGDPVRTRWHETQSAEDLWRWVDGETRANGRTVAYAHNLAYDLRVSRALDLLPRLGWRLERYGLDGRTCWLIWRRDRRSLVMTDSLSWYPCSLEYLAMLLGRRKLRMPSALDGLAAWQRYCRVDVEILRDAVLLLHRWLESDDHGSWRLTGPAQAWASYRHRYLPSRRLLSHGHRPALDAEREAAWTGRCEAWRHGDQRGTWVEHDWTLSYASLCRDTDLPAYLEGEMDGDYSGWLDRPPSHVRWIALATVDQPEPVLPARGPAGIVWPVGRVRGCWWDCELRLAAEEGAHIETERVWWYTAHPFLNDWAAWIEQSVAEDGPYPPAIRLVVKTWARSMLGRFAAQHPVWQLLGEARDRMDVRWWTWLDIDSGERGESIQVGRQIWNLVDRDESAGSMPQVWSCIAAEARVRLWRTIRAAGAEHVAYMDTDSVLVDSAGSVALARWSRTPEGSGLRVKGAYRRPRILGPRQLDLGDQVRIAGLPKTAQRLDDERYQAEVWRSLPESLRQGEHDRVVVTRRVITIAGADGRRVHLPDGSTRPLTDIDLAIDEIGTAPMGVTV